MKVLLTSVCVTVALGVGAASACEWQKSVTASAAPMPAEERKAPAQATAVDPVLLAALDKAAELQASKVAEAK